MKRIYENYEDGQVYEMKENNEVLGVDYDKYYEDKYVDASMDERLMYIQIALDGIFELLEDRLGAIIGAIIEKKEAKVEQGFKVKKVGADIAEEAGKLATAEAIAKIFGNR